MYSIDPKSFLNIIFSQETWKSFHTAHKQRHFWDGQTAVYVVLVGSTVVLPCVNLRSIWLKGNKEEEQQVVHWVRQVPGVQHDQANRLIDLYASGERRHYGPLFIQQKMNISASAFSYGNLSSQIYSLWIRACTPATCITTTVVCMRDTSSSSLLGHLSCRSPPMPLMRCPMKTPVRII